MGTSKLTDDLERQICGLVEMGCYEGVAARAVGITPQTLHRWLQRGAEQAAHGRYARFRAALLRAEARAEVAATVALRRGWEADWRAAATYLARRYPTRWGERPDPLARPDRLDAPPTPTTPTLAALGLDDTQVAELARSLAQRCGLPRPPEDP